MIKSIQQNFDQPIVDQTGLTERYDIQLNWKTATDASKSAAIQEALLAQLGLEMTPGRAPMQLLIVEKIK